MTLRFYLVPAVPCVRAGEEIPNSRCPKYIAAAAGLTWGAMDYGAEPLFLVLADVTGAQHTQLTDQGDVTSIVRYDNLDNTLNASQVSAVSAGLEALSIPGQWVNTSHTWRDVLRITASCFQLAQRMYGLHGRTIFRDGVDLSRTVSSLPAGLVQDLQEVAGSFGWDYSEITGSWTLREVLRHLAAQWGATEFRIAGFGGLSF